MSSPLSLAPILKYPQGFQYNFIWPLAKDYILLDHQFPLIPGVFAYVSIYKKPILHTGKCFLSLFKSSLSLLPSVLPPISYPFFDKMIEFFRLFIQIP